MTHPDTEQPVEKLSMGTDPFERRWMIIALGLLVTFAVAVGVTGFALGFQVPDAHERVDPRTVANSPPWNDPGVRELGDGEYDVYIISEQFTYRPSEIRVPVGATVTFHVTSTDVQHGFMLQDTNVNMQVVPGEVSKLTYEFDQVRNHDIICNEFCGVGHAVMAGKVIVEPVEEDA